MENSQSFSFERIPLLPVDCIDPIYQKLGLSPKGDKTFISATLTKLEPKRAISKFGSEGIRTQGLPAQEIVISHPKNLTVFYGALFFDICVTLFSLLQNQFLEKNNDALHASLEFLIQDSKNPLLQRLFADDPNVPKAKTAGKLNFISVGSKFRKQLDILMEKLRSTVSSNSTIQWGYFTFR